MPRYRLKPRKSPAACVCVGEQTFVVIDGVVDLPDGVDWQSIGAIEGPEEGGPTDESVEEADRGPNTA